MVTTNQPPFVPSMSLMLLRYMHKFVCLPHFFPNHGPFPYLQQPWLPLNNHEYLTASCFCKLFFFPFFLAIKRKNVCILSITYIFSKIVPFLLLPAHCMWILYPTVISFLIFAQGTVIFWVCVIINSLKKQRPQCYTHISGLCTDKLILIFIAILTHQNLFSYFNSRHLIRKEG